MTGELARCNDGWEGTATHEATTVRPAISREGDKDGIWQVEFGPAQDLVGGGEAYGVNVGDVVDSGAG